MASFIYEFGVVPLFLFNAWIVEKHFVSRPAVLPNVFVVLVPFATSSSEVPSAVWLWLLPGAIIGGFLFLFYNERTKLPWWFYSALYLFYSMKTIVGFYLASVFLGINAYSVGLGFILSLVAWFVGIRYCQNGLPFHRSLVD